MNAVEQVTARLAIAELFGRYAHTVDGYDSPGWVSCFTPDGIFEVTSPAGGGVCFKGHEALSRFMEAHIRLLPGTRHVQTNHVIEFVNQSSADHRCTLSGTLSRPENVYVFANGYYKSRVELHDSEWKIRHRTVCLDNGEALSTGALAVHMQPMMSWIQENGSPV